MPFDGSRGTELIPRATVEQIVGHRNRALELYGEAFTAIELADRAIKAAHAAAALASGDTSIHRGGTGDEVDAFHKAVALPDGDTYREVARRLTDMRVWSWVVQRTDLERLMDVEAKETLRRQMQYIPVKRRDQGWRNVPMTGEEAEAGMPPVTVDNIYATIQQFASDADSIFRRGIANAFSKLDRRFRSHDGFKIGSRVILTNAFDGFSGRLNWGNKRDVLLDIERAFAVLDKQSLGVSSAGCIEALDADRRKFYGAAQSLTQTEYFRIRGFMNGNAHLWMTRDDLVEKVNKLLAEWYGEVIGDGQTKAKDPFSGAEFRLPAKRFGFYPTPDRAADALLEHVPLYRAKDAPRLKILEPSAGTGNLARRLASAYKTERGKYPEPEKKVYYGHDVDCIEVQPELATKLRNERSFDASSGSVRRIYRRVSCGDFLAITPSEPYDLVVMNPPFDLERDIDHVIHALKFLKPDGELHAIMSAGTEFRETRKAIAFRKLVEGMSGRFSELPAGSFSSVGTNVNTCILRVRKDGKSRYW